MIIRNRTRTVFIVTNHLEQAQIPTEFFPRLFAAFIEWYPTLTDIKIPHVSESDYVIEPNYMQMIAVTANQVGVGGLRMERPLLITETRNELLSKMPFEPWVIERCCFVVKN